RPRAREGLTGREVLPRRQAPHHRRGHERDPAARDRAAVAGPVTGGSPSAAARGGQPSWSAPVRAGDPRALARAISLVEDNSPIGADVLRRLFADTGRAYVIGVTG